MAEPSVAALFVERLIVISSTIYKTLFGLLVVIASGS